MRAITFAAIGDCIVDRYIKQKINYLGGTAVNSAFAAREAGATSYIISAVGNDNAGKKFQQAFFQEGIQTKYLQVIPGSTSSLDVNLQDVDNPEYSNWQLGVLADFALTSEAKNFLKDVDVVKTILFWPMKKMFIETADLKLSHTLKVGDFSGVSEYTEGIESLQKYSHGFDIVVKSLDADNIELANLLQSIAKKQNKIVLGLLGDKGSVVFTKKKEYRQDIKKANIVDTNGAGDAYITTFAIDYLQSKNIQLAMEKGTDAASRIIQLRGAFGKSISA